MYACVWFARMRRWFCLWPLSATETRHKFRKGRIPYDHACRYVRVLHLVKYLLTLTAGRFSTSQLICALFEILGEKRPFFLGLLFWLIHSRTRIDRWRVFQRMISPNLFCLLFNHSQLVQIFFRNVKGTTATASFIFSQLTDAAPSMQNLQWPACLPAWRASVKLIQVVALNDHSSEHLVITKKQQRRLPEMLSSYFSSI